MSARGLGLSPPALAAAAERSDHSHLPVSSTDTSLEKEPVSRPPSASPGAVEPPNVKSCQFGTAGTQTAAWFQRVSDVAACLRHAHVSASVSKDQQSEKACELFQPPWMIMCVRQACKRGG